MKYTIAYDLDATLCQTIRRNHPEDIPYVKPIEWEVKNVRKLKRNGHKIVIFSRRGHLKGARDLTIAWLKKHKVPYDKLILEKPEYDILIDDRASNPFMYGQLTAESILEEARLIRNHMKRNCYKTRRK